MRSNIDPKNGENIFGKLFTIQYKDYLIFLIKKIKINFIDFLFLFNIYYLANIVDNIYQIEILVGYNKQKQNKIY